MDIDLSRARWRKSVRSGGVQECVEVADNLRDVVGVRDSKDRQGATLLFTHREWGAFIAGVKNT